MVKSMSYTFFASDRIGNDDPSKTRYCLPLCSVIFLVILYQRTVFNQTKEEKKRNFLL